MTSLASARDRLLAAARELFPRHGYEAVSVRALTARAKVNLGAVTYHFGSKTALFHAAIESIAEPFADTVASAAATPGTELDRVEAVVRAVLRHLAGQPAAPRMLLRELANDRPLPPPMARLMKRNVGVLVGLITAGQEEGTIRTGDPLLLALSVVAQPFYVILAGPIIQQALAIDRSDPRIRARLVDHVAQSVRRTIANHPEAEP